jgi:hypothetical protein
MSLLLFGGVLGGWGSKPERAKIGLISMMRAGPGSYGMLEIDPFNLDC